MIIFNKLKSKNPFLKIIYSIINLVISLLVGILNLFIGIGKWFYKILTKNYKYEFLYIAIISGVAIFFEILAINGFQKQQLYTWLGNSPSICMFLLDISIGLFIFGLIGYILVIFKNFEVTK